MNYSEPLVNQINIFLKALGSGVILAVVYEVVSFVRIIFGEKKTIYIVFDAVFVFIASLISFFFMVLYNSGQVRFNLMIAEFIGGVGFHRTFGRYILSAAEKYVSKIKGFLCLLFMPLVRIIKKALSFMYKKLSTLRHRCKKTKIFEKNIKNISNIRKILLKNKNKSV